jgi:hypothetical protein
MSTHGRSLVIGVFVATAGVLVLAQTITGPSSSASPYMLRVESGVVSAAILTVGDAVDGYRLVGIPDGLGAFDNGDGTFTLLANHEIPGSQGIPRAHGAPGAFVSRWIIRKNDLAVLHGSDLIQEVARWNVETSWWDAPAKGVAMSRLCSADLAPISALYDAARGLGYAGRIFLNGEEVSPNQEGRAFAHLGHACTVVGPACGDRRVRVEPIRGIRDHSGRSTDDGGELSARRDTG